MVFHQQRVQHQQDQDQRRKNRHVRHVQPHQQRRRGRESPGEPEPEPAQSPGQPQIATEDLEAFLVPPEDGAGKQRADDQREHRHPDQPIGFPGPLIGAGEIDAQQVQDGQRVHGFSGPEVHAAHPAAQIDVGDDVANRLVGAPRARVVELRQHDPGDDQDDQRDSGQTAEAVAKRVGVRGDSIFERADP